MNAVRTTPRATPRIALPASCTTLSPRSPASAPAEAPDPPAARLAHRIHDRRDHHGQQELHADEAEAADLATRTSARRGPRTGRLPRRGPPLPSSRTRSRPPRPARRRPGSSHPVGCDGHLETAQALRPARDLVGVLHDRADRRRERRDEDEQQRERHHRDREPALVPEPALHREHHRPGRDDDHGRPDDRGEERPEDPDGREDQAAHGEHREDGTGEIATEFGRSECFLSRSTLPAGCGGRGYPPRAAYNAARNNRMTTVFSRSMKNAPTSGTTRNATCEAPWRWVTAVMFAIAVGVAPSPKPMKPALITAAS